MKFEMALWQNDDELFSIARRELFPALLGDVLDKGGYLNQFLPYNIKPLDAGMTVIGRAMPVLEADVCMDVTTDGVIPIARKPFGLMFEALDDVKKNEVYICSGASPNYALWGGLMNTRAMKLGSAGTVVNGFTRDTNEILKCDFPVFGMGTYAQDQEPRGHVVDFRIPILFDNVKVSPGDIVFGDRDGVIIIPSALEEDAFSQAIQKARGEKIVKEALESGMSSVKAFETFGIM